MWLDGSSQERLDIWTFEIFEWGLKIMPQILQPFIPWPNEFSFASLFVPAVVSIFSEERIDRNGWKIKFTHRVIPNQIDLQYEHCDAGYPKWYLIQKGVPINWQHTQDIKTRETGSVEVPQCQILLCDKMATVDWYQWYNGIKVTLNVSKMNTYLKGWSLE